MSILVSDRTRLLMYGATTPAGSVYTRRMRDLGTQIVADVSPGHGGLWAEGVPVFDTAREAVLATDADTALICVPAPEAAEAILETADAGIELVVCATSHVPVRDMIQIKTYLRDKRVRLVGPGSPGIFTPGQCVVGAIASHILQPGQIGVLARSGSLAYEATWLLTQAGLGQSTIIGIGDGLIVGLGFVDVLAMLEDDPQTAQVLLLGEIGGQEEERAAAFARDEMTKPVVAFVTGQTAPPGRRMGHQGAIIEGYEGTAQAKVEALVQAGVRVADTLQEVPRLLARREHYEVV